MTEEREDAKDFIPLIYSFVAAIMISAIVTATLFMGAGTQAPERTAAASLPHAQHHIFSIR